VLQTVTSIYVHVHIKVCFPRDFKKNLHRHINNDAFEKLVMLEIPTYIYSEK